MVIEYSDDVSTYYLSKSLQKLYVTETENPSSYLLIRLKSPFQEHKIVINGRTYTYQVKRTLYF